MSDEQVEDVAKAIWDARRAYANNAGIQLEYWGDGAIPRANGIMDEARAAIEAIGIPASLADANAACLELAAAHGFATGHGDTVADVIREFSAQINQWRPISSAPKDGMPVLINYDLGFALDHYDGPLMCVCWRTGDDWQGGASQVPTFRPTHWRPLPAQAEGAMRNTENWK